MECLTSPPGLRVGTSIANADDVAHTITITLRDTAAPDQVLATKSVASGEHWGSTGMQIPATIDLKEGQSLEIATATPVSTTSPYVWALYEDRV